VDLALVDIADLASRNW